MKQAQTLNPLYTSTSVIGILNQIEISLYITSRIKLQINFETEATSFRKR